MGTEYRTSKDRSAVEMETTFRPSESGDGDNLLAQKRLITISLLTLMNPVYLILIYYFIYKTRKRALEGMSIGWPTSPRVDPLLLLEICCPNSCLGRWSESKLSQSRYGFRIKAPAENGGYNIRWIAPSHGWWLITIASRGLFSSEVRKPTNPIISNDKPHRSELHCPSK